MRGDLALHLGGAGKRAVPAHFKLAGHVSIGGIGGMVLPEGTVDGVARRFKIAAERVAHLIPLSRGLLRGYRRRSDRPRSNHAEKRFLDRIVDAQATKSDAMGATIVHPGAVAGVARDVVLGAGVAQRQLAASALAAEQASK